jgi:hypothetical protein
MKVPVILSSLAWLALSWPAQAAPSCYMDWFGRQLNLAMLCGQHAVSNPLIEIPQLESNILIYGLHTPSEWQQNRWRTSQKVAGRIVNSGRATAYNVQLTIRAVNLGEDGQLEKTEIKSIVVQEFPPNSAATFEVAFDFMPSTYAIEHIEWQ